MTRDDIIRMTSEASGDGGVDELTGDAIERFANSVATFAAAAEREACAKVCEQDDSMRWSGAAAAIRERSQS